LIPLGYASATGLLFVHSHADETFDNERPPRSAMAGRPFWPWMNMRIGLQYTLWDKFDGASTNFNGAGRNAHNNNTIFVYAWTMF
jgi:hypothetical protein